MVVMVGWALVCSVPALMLDTDPYNSVLSVVLKGFLIGFSGLTILAIYYILKK